MSATSALWGDPSGSYAMAYAGVEPPKPAAPVGPYDSIIWTVPDPWESQFDDIVNAIKATATKDYALNTENGNPSQWRGSRVVTRWVPDFYHDLKARHVLYWVKQPPGYTNGVKTKASDSERLDAALAIAKNPALKTANTLGKISSITGYAFQGLAGAAGVAALASGAGIASATGVATGVAGAGSGTLGSLAGLASNPITIVALAGLTVWSIISAHHAKAVALEHINDSAMADYVNKFLDDAYGLIENGAMSVAQWREYAATMMQDAITITAPSYKNGNAAWHLRWRLRALLELQYRMIMKQETAKQAAQQAATDRAKAILPPAFLAAAGGGLMLL